MTRYFVGSDLIPTMDSSIRGEGFHTRKNQPFPGCDSDTIVFPKTRGRKKTLVFDFYATTPFDFFSAMYVLIARRLFCLLRLCQFFRASCFMLILLVRRDKPAGYLRMGVPHGEGLATHAGLESCVAVRKFKGSHRVRQ